MGVSQSERTVFEVFAVFHKLRSHFHRFVIHQLLFDTVLLKLVCVTLKRFLYIGFFYLFELRCSVHAQQFVTDNFIFWKKTKKCSASLVTFVCTGLASAFCLSSAAGKRLYNPVYPLTMDDLEQELLHLGLQTDRAHGMRL